MLEPSAKEMFRRIAEDYKLTIVERPEKEFRYWRKCFGDRTQFWITNLEGTDLPLTFGEPFLLWIWAFGELIHKMEVESLRSFFPEYESPYPPKKYKGEK